MEAFNPTREPLRALRDLIEACEVSDAFGLGAEAAVLERAQAAFTLIRKIFGDESLAEDIADRPMIEPAPIASVPALIAALQLAAGALQTMERLSLVDPQAPIRFTGKWSPLGTVTISDILDATSAALGGAAP